MLIVTGDCLSSGHEFLDPQIFGADWKKLLDQSPREFGNYRVKKIKELYIDPDPKYQKKSEWVKMIFAQKKIMELELPYSWPIQLGKKLNIEVINLADEGANFLQQIQKFENFLSVKSPDVKVVIHQIPGHWRVSIKGDEHDHFRMKLVGPNILDLDTFASRVKNIFNKPVGEQHLMSKYKKYLKQPEFFNNLIKQGLKKNKELEKKYNFKTYYILTQHITKQCLTDEIILHDDLKPFAQSNFLCGTDCPVVDEYVDYMINLVSPVIDKSFV